MGESRDTHATDVAGKTVAEKADSSSIGARRADSLAGSLLGPIFFFWPYEASVEELSVGTLVDAKYRIQARLGTGAQAFVYEAVNEALGKAVVLKIARAGRPLADKGLLVEGRALARLTHPHVPGVYDLGNLENGTPYLVLQRLPGSTLRELFATQRLSLHQQLSVASQVLGALHAVSSAGMVHRDVKPENVLVDLCSSGLIATLIDFGVATAAGSPSKTFVGTPLYAAPELLSGSHLDGRADLFSLGVVLFEGITGALPFAGRSVNELLFAVLQGHEPVRQLCPSCPDELAEIVERSLSFAPDRRYPTALAMLDALRRTVDGRTSGAS